MNVLVSWLREFAELPAGGPDELAAVLSARGLEVAGVTLPPPGVPRQDAARPDGVIDLEITANRPDCLSVIGVARELAAAYDAPLHLDRVPPVPPERAGGDLSDLTVRLEDAELCPRYAAAVVDVRVGPSPAWMAARLVAAGVRPINNVVDVTNYVLVELGHPMHAFDLERLAGRELRIRRARAGERIRTLDGEDRALEETMLVIADATRPQAIAGVMGGAASEVSAATRLVALESAFFQPVSVRRTSKRLGLSTDASYRFERGADVNAPLVALARAGALLGEIGAGSVRGAFIDCYPAPQARRQLQLRHARVERLLGARIDAAFIERILGRLGFALTPVAAGYNEDATWQVTVPTWRVDVSREVDLIEEIARHYGYDRLPATFPPLVVPPAPPHPSLEQERLIRHILTGLGFDEAMTFSFVDLAQASFFAPESASRVDVANPLSAKFSVMRPSMIPGLIEALGYNRRRQSLDVRLFELGKIFSGSGERRALGVAWCGAGSPPFWKQEAQREVDLFDLKGVVETVCRACGTRAELRPTERSFLVSGRAAEAVDDHGDLLGIVGAAAPQAVSDADVQPFEVYVAELDLDRLLEGWSRVQDSAVRPPPKHPSVARDIAIVIDERLPAGTVRGTIRAAAPSTLVNVREFDRYQGQGIPAGHVSLALRLTFRAADRTLTDAEVQGAVEKIVGALAQAHGAALR